MKISSTKFKVNKFSTQPRDVAQMLLPSELASIQAYTRYPEEYRDRQEVLRYFRQSVLDAMFSLSRCAILTNGDTAINVRLHEDSKFEPVEALIVSSPQKQRIQQSGGTDNVGSGVLLRNVSTDNFQRRQGASSHTRFYLWNNLGMLWPDPFDRIGDVVPDGDAIFERVLREGSRFVKDDFMGESFNLLIEDSDVVGVRMGLYKSQLKMFELMETNLNIDTRHHLDAIHGGLPSYIETRSAKAGGLASEVENNSKEFLRQLRSKKSVSDGPSSEKFSARTFNI